MEKTAKIISVDLQKDFSASGGKHYKPHSNVAFIIDKLVPYLRTNSHMIAEIVSDYRQPRPGDKDDSCNPGTIGYESELPEDIKIQPIWIKCMNSPIWSRANAGNPNAKAGLPYENTDGFGKWLSETVGSPESSDIVLIGLTIDCCVLCTAQELCMRGYKVFVLEEGVDTYSGDTSEKELVIKGPILKNWAEVISWDEAKRKLEQSNK